MWRITGPSIPALALLLALLPAGQAGGQPLATCEERERAARVLIDRLAVSRARAEGEAAAVIARQQAEIERLRAEIDRLTKEGKR